MRKRALLGTCIAAVVLAAVPSARSATTSDSKPPVCFDYAIPGPPKRLRFIIGDGRSGLAAVLPTKSENADTVVPPFTIGTNEPVIVSSTKIDQARRAKIVLRLADVDGEKRVCRREF